MHISVIQFLVSPLMELLWCHFDLALDDLKGTFGRLDAKPGGNPLTKSCPEKLAFVRLGMSYLENRINFELTSNPSLASMQPE